MFKRKYAHLGKVWRRLKKYYRLIPHGYYMANFSVDRAKLFAIINYEFKTGSFQWIYLTTYVMTMPFLTVTMFNEEYSAVKSGEINYTRLKREKHPLFPLVDFYMKIWRTSIDEIITRRHYIGTNVYELMEVLNDKYSANKTEQKSKDKTSSEGTF